jgi:hypothetical protein
MNIYGLTLLPAHYHPFLISQYLNFLRLSAFVYFINLTLNIPIRQYQLPRGLSPEFAVAQLLSLRVRIQPVAWMSVSCECWVLLGKRLCVELITPPEESNRVYVLLCVIVNPR